MEHCEDHMDFLKEITTATSRIGEMQEHIIAMHEDIKATRSEVSDAVKKAEEQLVTNTKDLAVLKEKLKNTQWMAGIIIGGESALLLYFITNAIKHGAFVPT